MLVSTWQHCPHRDSACNATPLPPHRPAPWALLYWPALLSLPYRPGRHWTDQVFSVSHTLSRSQRSIAVTAGTAGTLVSKWRGSVLWFAAADCIRKSTASQCCGTVTIYYGSGSGSDFWKVMVPVPVPTFEKLWFRFQFLLLKSYGSGSGSSSISKP